MLRDSTWLKMNNEHPTVSFSINIIFMHKDVSKRTNLRRVMEPVHLLGKLVCDL